MKIEKIYGFISMWWHKRQGGACFLPPAGEEKVHQWEVNVGSLLLCTRPSCCKPSKSWELALKVFAEGRWPTNCAVLNDLAGKREPRSSLPCTFSPPSEHSSEVIIWQKTLWNRSDSWNYDEDEAWLLGRPRNLCSVSGRYATVGMGRWVGGNKDEEEHESGGLVKICESKGNEEKLKYKFRFSMCIWIFKEWWITD